MAVNENLYSWLLKTQGMPAAEWYRNNPTKPHTSNPHVPPGAAKWFPQASSGGSEETYASASPDIIEESITDNSPSSYLQALYQMPEDEYETFRANVGKNINRFESEEQLRQLYPGATYSQYQVPKYDNILLDYGIGYKDYGSGAHYLFNKLINSPEFTNLETKQENLWKQGQDLRRPYSSGEETAAGLKIVDFEGYSKVSDQYERLMSERQGYANQQRALAQQYNSLYSGKPVEGWDENAFYAEKISLPTRQNLAALIQQSEQGINSSKQFLDDYVAKGGEGTEPKYGPRGEDLGEVAWNTPAIPMGPYTPVRNYGTRTNPSYAPSTKDTHNNPGGARVTPIQFVQENQPVDVRVARAAEKSDEQRERLAQQSEFDLSKEKQLASAKAADAYRRSAANEDPFRAAARVG